PVPALSMERLEKVATPATALTGVVPERVPAAGLVPMAKIGGAACRERVLNWARAGAVTAGVMASRGVVLAGWVPKTRWLPAAALVLEVLEVTGASPLLVAARV